MSRARDLTALRETTPESAANSLYRARKQLRVHVHKGPIVTVRKARHRNHEIEIRTTYDIRIDGRRVIGHIELGNDGRLHYHGLPAYGWSSAVDMSRQLIDSFPADFPGKGKAPRKPSKPATKKKRRYKKTYKGKVSKTYRAQVKKKAKKPAGKRARKGR